MPDKVTYEYAIIRIVPKVEREEFFNVGILLFSKRHKFLGMVHHIDEAKFTAFSCDIDVNLFNDYLKVWEQVCDGNPNGNSIEQMELADRFRWLAAAKSSALQCSKTHAGLTDNPEKELAVLFKLFVR